MNPQEPKTRIHIDQDKCIGCGVCASTCHQAAIAMVNGKAMVQGESLCDGLGRCLPVCPVSAISFLELPVSPCELDTNHSPNIPNNNQKNSCPSSEGKTLELPNASARETSSCLQQWPVQIKLVLPEAGFFHKAKLLIAADCSAFAYGNFHQDFMKDHVTLIGCPKLDHCDYSQKLGEILEKQEISQISLVRMEVPCCGGLEYALEEAVKRSGKDLEVHVSIISVEGKLVQ